MLLSQLNEAGDPCYKSGRTRTVRFCGDYYAAACVFTVVGSILLDTSDLPAARTRSSEAMQIRKQTMLASNKFRLVTFIEASSALPMLSCTSNPHSSMIHPK